MSRRNAVQTAIEKAKAEIAFQHRLIDALEATQKAQASTKRGKKTPKLATPDASLYGTVQAGGRQG